jgi:hypothetical protein
MITDRLDRCPFCQHELVAASVLLDCPEETSHQDIGRIWAWFDPIRGAGYVKAINLVYKNYQLHFDLTEQKTQLWSARNKDPRQTRDLIMDVPYLMDFPLDLETIDKKIKTMLTFM